MHFLDNLFSRHGHIVKLYIFRPPEVSNMMPHEKLVQMKEMRARRSLTRVRN